MCKSCIFVLQAPSMFEQYKMIMVVRADLKMGKGKVAAQVSKFVYQFTKYAIFSDSQLNIFFRFCDA